MCAHSMSRSSLGMLRSGLNTSLRSVFLMCGMFELSWHCILTLKACLLFESANLSLQRKLLFPLLHADVIPSITIERQIKIKENTILVQFSISDRKV